MSFFFFVFSLLFVILTSLLHCNVLGHRSDHVVGRSEEAAYLSGLKTLWRGFIHMHAVAKLVTKAFSVSGIMDNLNEVTDKNESTYKYLSARFYPVLFANRTFQTAFRLGEGSLHRLCGITWRRFEQLAQK